jgi:predicted nucleotidyltransferase
LKVYPFGSYLRGEADNESDIDILVDLDYNQKVGLLFIQLNYYGLKVHRLEKERLEVFLE